MLTLRLLEIFRAVISTGSFTAAGERLQMSQPAVTKAIKRMEDQLGFVLFAKARGRIFPTPEAMSLHAEVDKVFHSVRIVEKYAHDLKEAHSGVLSLACTPTMSYSFLTEAIARFREERPKVRVWLQITTTKETLELAAAGQVDLGLIYAPIEHHSVNVIPLFETEVVCVMRPDHDLAAARSIPVAALKDQVIITNVRNQPLHDLVERAFGAKSLDRSVMIGTNSTITACTLVRSDAGIAIVEPMGIFELFPDLVLRPLEPRIRLVPRVVHTRNASLSRIAARFMELLRDTVRGTKPA